MSPTVEGALFVLTLILIFGPFLAERIRVPGLVGLIALGTVAGPNVLDWLQPEGFVAEIGAVGLLYLMFLAGLELDTPEIERVMVITGRLGQAPSRWADGRLALDIARRIVARTSLPLVVLTPDTQAFHEQLALRDDEAVERSPVGSGAALAALRPGDLVVIPAHAVRDARYLGWRRLAEAVVDVSVAVVAGPNRLVMSAGADLRTATGMVNATHERRSGRAARGT